MAKLITISFHKSFKKILLIPNIQPTKTDKEVSDIFWEPYITSGYRVPNKSWSYYACSLFQVHNETLNVWTHLLGLFIILYQILQYGEHLDYIKNKNSWPVLAFGILAMITLGFSSFCHLFHSKSVSEHYICYLIDYIGTSLYGHAGTLLIMYYSSNKQDLKYSGLFYMVINSIISVFSCTCSCISKLKYDRPYPPTRKLWLILPELFHMLYGSFPLFLRGYACFTDPHCPYTSLNHHLYYYFTCFIGFLFFSSDIPEKFGYGYFDIVGHGHQWFHIFTLYSIYLQMEAAFQDYKTRSHEVLDHMQPDFLSVFGLILIVVLLDVIIIYHMLHIYRKKINKNVHSNKMK